MPTYGTYSCTIQSSAGIRTGGGEDGMSLFRVLKWQLLM